MNRSKVAQHLEKYHSRSQTADFFLAPKNRPDLVMEVLIEKKKADAGKPAAPRPPKTVAKSEPPPKPRLGKKSRALSPPFKLAARLALALCVFTAISCAVAPNTAATYTAIKVVDALDSAENTRMVESIGDTAGAALQTVWTMFSGSPLSESAKSSVAYRLLSGNWTGLALIQPDGGVAALAKPEDLDRVSEWMSRYGSMEEENDVLRQTLNSIQSVRDSQKIYLEIDLDENLLFVKMGTKTLYKFPVVTGRGYASRESGRKYRFRTPRGIMTVKKKEKWPIWYPPAWHWAERGTEAPAVRGGLRGVLGKYRLNLGNAYGIHGTSRGRIGRPGKYSHGCVRMNRADLEIVFKLSDVGTEVYIY